MFNHKTLCFENLCKVQGLDGGKNKGWETGETFCKYWDFVSKHRVNRSYPKLLKWMVYQLCCCLKTWVRLYCSLSLIRISWKCTTDCKLLVSRFKVLMKNSFVCQNWFAMQINKNKLNQIRVGGDFGPGLRHFLFYPLGPIRE